MLKRRTENEDIKLLKIINTHQYILIFFKQKSLILLSTDNFVVTTAITIMQVEMLKWYVYEYYERENVLSYYIHRLIP